MLNVVCSQKFYPTLQAAIVFASNMVWPACTYSHQAQPPTAHTKQSNIITRQQFSVFSCSEPSRRVVFSQLPTHHGNHFPNCRTAAYGTACGFLESSPAPTHTPLTANSSSRRLHARQPPLPIRLRPACTFSATRDADTSQQREPQGWRQGQQRTSSSERAPADAVSPRQTLVSGLSLDRRQRPPDTMKQGELRTQQQRQQQHLGSTSQQQPEEVDVNWGLGAGLEAAALENGNDPLPGPGLPEVSYISSTSNAYVKHLVRLRTSGPYRRQLRRGVLVGAELIVEAAADCCGPLPVRLLLLADGVPLPAPSHLSGSCRVVHCSEAVMKKVSGVESASGVTAVAELQLPPELSLQQLLATAEAAAAAAASTTLPSPFAAWAPLLPALPPLRLLVLDGVQDPGNLGTLARTALAFGWSGLMLLPGCCDPLNDKALRASRGALLRLPVAVGELGDLEAAAEGGRLLMLCADMEDEDEDEAEGKGKREVKVGDRDEVEEGEEGVGWRGVALVLGAEGLGLSEGVRRLCRPVAVPMEGRMESLNVGVAGALLMFALSQGPQVLFGRLAEKLGGRGGRGRGQEA